MTKKTEGGPLLPVKPATRLVTGGRDPFAQHGYVNTPVYHASTLLYRTAEEYLARRGRYQYGRKGTPTSEALAGAIAELEGPQCAGVALLPSGLTAACLAHDSHLAGLGKNTVELNSEVRGVLTRGSGWRALTCTATITVWTRARSWSLRGGSNSLPALSK